MYRYSLCIYIFFDIYIFKCSSERRISYVLSNFNLKCISRWKGGLLGTLGLHILRESVPSPTSLNLIFALI